ncbi:hypothetical protein EYF80_056128 [Liparis tanakae]|uniref:Uncharacterized protein n=1 Tax=Liparis tanakae TaxID=230148 RepID=A0A4Z2EY30_9TELE|nr:hypothetical protein EYF80_056128 [Liparis tanakae]
MTHDGHKLRQLTALANQEPERDDEVLRVFSDTLQHDGDTQVVWEQTQDGLMNEGLPMMIGPSYEWAVIGGGEKVQDGWRGYNQLLE